MAAATDSVTRNQWRAWYIVNDLGTNDEQTLALFETLYVESGFHNWANVNVPVSQTIPNDGVRSDNNSVGVLQQQVATDGGSKGWGNVNQAMDPDHAVREFLQHASGSSKKGQGAHMVAENVQKSAYDGKTVLPGWSGPKPYGSNYQASEQQAKDQIARFAASCTIPGGK